MNFLIISSKSLPIFLAFIFRKFLCSISFFNFSKIIREFL
ncbi:hypothetical protein BSPA14S_H0004 (plasmid) [Borreliella spielmanii A14S]|uniref:Uncharacterized protein n=1 Tax=Borreliella spielmanii A14S TaxID=498742 RepID=C0RCD0_9SPIR|nr:hypothetical protein BSPA14S_H0004 [Borreliella spielmanii A14S]